MAWNNLASMKLSTLWMKLWNPMNLSIGLALLGKSQAIIIKLLMNPSKMFRLGFNFNHCYQLRANLKSIKRPKNRIKMGFCAEVWSDQNFWAHGRISANLGSLDFPKTLQSQPLWKPQASTNPQSQANLGEIRIYKANIEIIFIN